MHFFIIDDIPSCSSIWLDTCSSSQNYYFQSQIKESKKKSFFLQRMKCEINIIMIEVGNFPVIDLPPGRPFFKKGDFYSHFYFLQEGKATVTVRQVSIEVQAPMFLGDYQITVDIEYRTSSIKSISRCKIRTIPVQYYPQVGLYNEMIIAAFNKFTLKGRGIHYWLKKLFKVQQHKRNDQVRCDNGLGIVLKGEFRLNSNIPIVRMKEPNLQLLRKFQICSLGQQELFEESVDCESHRGITGVMDQKYISQLFDHFDEFKTIISMASFKHSMHVSMKRQIAYNCKKKQSLFQNMVPLTLKNSIKIDPSERSQTLPNKSQLGRLAVSEEVYTIKDNISQFLHKQWRRGLSLKFPKKQRVGLKLDTIRKKKKVEEFTNPELINLQIPKEFKEVKFNFKMLVKTKENAQMRSRRHKTQSYQQTPPKLLFRD